MRRAVRRCARRFSFRGVSHRFVTWGRPSADDAVTPVVLIHGFSQSFVTWEKVAACVAQTRAVYAFELVGHGGSDRPEAAAAYGIEAQAEALLAFLAQVSREAGAGSGTARAAGLGGAPRPVVVGYSMGGRVALTAACRDSRPFGALVLEAAGLGPANEDERAAALTRDLANAERLRVEGVESFMDFWEGIPLFATQHALPEAVRASLRAERLSNDAEALARSFEQAGQHTMRPRAAILTALGQSGLRVLYLAGELDRKYRSLSDEVAALPHAEACVVSQVGHDVHLESPLEFVRHLTRFLDLLP